MPPNTRSDRYTRTQHWGQPAVAVANPASPAESSSVLTLDQIGDLAVVGGRVAQELTGGGPIQRAQVLRAQLSTALARGAPLRVIQDLQAKVSAADRQAQMHIESEQARRTWRTIGMVAAAVGIGVGGLVVLNLARKGFAR